MLRAEDAGAVHVGGYGAAADEAGDGGEVEDEVALHGGFVWWVCFFEVGISPGDVQYYMPWRWEAYSAVEADQTRKSETQENKKHQAI